MNMQSTTPTKSKTTVSPQDSASAQPHPATVGKTYRRKKPSLMPDQPLPNPPEAVGIQHAFCSPKSNSLRADQGFDFCQTSLGHGADAGKDDLLPSVEKLTPLLASAGKVPSCRLSGHEMAPALRKRTEPSRGACGDDSDSCDFNEIDNEIQDTLLKRSPSSEDEQVLRASQRPFQMSPEKSSNPLCNSSSDPAGPTSFLPHQQHVETTSTTDSMQEIHLNDSTSPIDASAEVTWCVTMPSETVLLVDSLHEFLQGFGKVLVVRDINDHIQVQYEEKEHAYALQQAVADISEQQYSAQVAKLINARCLVPKKKIFDDAHAELTLKLLKISPKVNELAVVKSDSEFLQEYNSTAKKQTHNISQSEQSQAQHIISTEGSECPSIEVPNFEQAYRMMTSGPDTSDVTFMFAPTAQQFGNFQAQPRSHVALSRFDQPMEKHAQPMQSTVYSDVGAANGPRNVGDVSLFESTADPQGHQTQATCLTSDSESQFVNSALFQHSAATFDNFGSSLKTSANQINYESHNFNAQQQPQKFAECHQMGPNRQHVPQRMKNPFSSGSALQQEEPSMSFQKSSTFFLTASNTSANGAPQQVGVQNGSNSSQHWKTDPQFAVNLDKILRGDDSRTTIMIRHIPNKYTEEMLLERINRCHEGRYDFFYLPLDLNNGCNIGYAFINFIDPVYIVPFYEDLNNQSWETFNSEKICQIAYGRIQGKRNLVENVNKQPENRKIKPLILDVGHQALAYVDCLRMELIAARQQQLFNTATNTEFRQFQKRQPRASHAASHHQQPVAAFRPSMYH